MTGDKSNIDLILENFDVNSNDEEDIAQINVWIPKSVKDKYNDLQVRTKKKFSKVLKNIIISSIERKSSE